MGGWAATAGHKRKRGPSKRLNFKAAILGFYETRPERAKSWVPERCSSTTAR